MLNFKGVDKQTWTRIIVMVLALVNQVSTSVFEFQILPFTNEQVYEGVSTVITVGATVWTSWKDNPVTKESQVANKHLKELKKKKGR